MARPLKSKKELKDETLEELEKEQKFFEERERKAAERSAAESKDELDELNIKEFLDSTADPVKKITEYEPEFFRDEDREKEEESYRGFGKSFLEILEEEEARKNKEKDLIGAKDRKKLAEAEKKKAEQARAYKEADLPGYDPEEKEYEFADYYTQKQRLSDSIYDRYVEGEKWLMSEGEGDLAKGFINNFRSSIGTGVEDFAYWLNDHASWYKPAKKVVEKNTAGKISDMAQRQFANAKAAGANEKYVDLMDSVSKGLGYNAFGFKVGNYIQGGAETFDEYRTLREKGYSKEEATKITASKIPLAILSAKADDYLGKNSRIDDVLYGKTRSSNPESNKKFMEALNSRNTNDIIITGEQIGKKIGEHTKEYGLNPGNVEDRIKLLNIVDDIIDNADEVVVGDNWRGQTGHPIFYIRGEDVVVVMEDNKKFVTILKGGIANERVKNARR